MAYSVHNFEQGDILYADQLNEMDAQIALNEQNINSGISSDMLAEDYSANKTYSIGDYVMYNNELYRCIYEITAAEGWNSAHWQKANLGDGISDLNRQLSEVEGTVFSGDAAVGTVLFTSEQVSPGDILYVNMTAKSTGATYIELRDSEEQRLWLFGKISSSSGVLTNIGVIVIPDGFSSAVLTGGSGATGAAFKYIQKEFPSTMITEIQNQYFGERRNLLEDANYQNDYGIAIITGEFIKWKNVLCNSGYLPVIPGSRIDTDWNIVSNRYGAGFYNSKLEFITGITSQATNRTFYVPDDAYFAVFTLTPSIIASSPHAYITLPQTAQVERKIDNNNFYKRFPIHEFGSNFNGYMHVAFPRMCYFAGKTVMVYRTGHQHMPRTDNTLPAVQQMDVREPDGTWKHVKSFSASDFEGATGDARDWYIQPSRNGQYLLMVGGFSHYVSGTVYYDCFVAVLNTNLEIVDYQLFLNNDYYFFGNPLVTPDGHIIFTYFCRTLKDTGIYRSEEVFSGTVSTLTFTRTALNTESSNHSECCLGYFNSKLVLMQRYEGTSAAKLMVTSDLEGLTGWSSPTSVRISIHSPLLLPYYKGKYLPVVGSRCFDTSLQNRQPYLYYIDIDMVMPVAYGDIDPSLITGYNGYPTFVPLDDENYAVAYYQESPNGTDAIPSTGVNTGIYYKWINAREIIPALAYLDV